MYVTTTSSVCTYRCISITTNNLVDTYLIYILPDPMHCTPRFHHVPAHSEVLLRRVGDGRWETGGREREELIIDQKSRKVISITATFLRALEFLDWKSIFLSRILKFIYFSFLAPIVPTFYTIFASTNLTLLVIIVLVYYIVDRDNRGGRGVSCQSY